LWGTSDELEKEISGPWQSPSVVLVSMLTPQHAIQKKSIHQATANFQK
jgi:hypothetical protein